MQAWASRQHQLRNRPREGTDRCCTGLGVWMFTGTTDDGESLGEEEDMSFASDRAVQPSTAASVASYSSLMTLDDDRGE